MTDPNTQNYPTQNYAIPPQPAAPKKKLGLGAVIGIAAAALVVGLGLGGGVGVASQGGAIGELQRDNASLSSQVEEQTAAVEAANADLETAQEDLSLAEEDLDAYAQALSDTCTAMSAGSYSEDVIESVQEIFDAYCAQ